MLATLARATLDLLLPPHCATCGATVSRPGELCASCFQGLDFITEPACLGCGLPFATREEAGPAGRCETCIASPPLWHQARAAFLYGGRAKELVLALKYADHTENAAILAQHMRRAGAALVARADILVPVPLHRWRLLHRRYNQAALLAHAIARRAHIPVIADALQRHRATASLGGLPAAERREALRNAIAARPCRLPVIAGRRVLLIDDVLTSGATATICTRALLDAGAANIDVLVASRVADPRRRLPASTHTDPDEDHADH